MQETQTKSSSHPYADRLQENLLIPRKLEGLLTNKVNNLTIEIKRYYDTKDFLDYNTSEKLFINEMEIQLIKVQAELDACKKSILYKDTYYKDYMVQFEKDMAEIDLKFKNTVAIARKSTKPNIVKLLSEIQWDKVDTDDEVKIAVYKQLKKHV